MLVYSGMFGYFGVPTNPGTSGTVSTTIPTEAPSKWNCKGVKHKKVDGDAFCPVCACFGGRVTEAYVAPVETTIRHIFHTTPQWMGIDMPDWELIGKDSKHIVEAGYVYQFIGDKDANPNFAPDVWEFTPEPIGSDLMADTFRVRRRKV